MVSAWPSDHQSAWAAQHPPGAVWVGPGVSVGSSLALPGGSPVVSRQRSPGHPGVGGWAPGGAALRAVWAAGLLPAGLLGAVPGV